MTGGMAVACGGEENDAWVQVRITAMVAAAEAACNEARSRPQRMDSGLSLRWLKVEAAALVQVNKLQVVGFDAGADVFGVASWSAAAGLGSKPKQFCEPRLTLSCLQLGCTEI